MTSVAGRSAETATRDLRRARLEVTRFGLDLTGLTVLTEAASGPYLATPVLAALAGAERVIAVTRDSRWATAAEVAAATHALANEAGVGDRLQVVTAVDAALAGAADVVTNTGFVRPIDARLVAWLRTTAAVALMFEPWEGRDGEVDLDACRARGVVVLGTNEHEPPCDMRPYTAALAVRLLFDVGVEVAGSRVLVLGGQALLGRPMADVLRAMSAEVVAFASSREASPDEGVQAYGDLGPADIEALDAVVVADHQERTLLLGPGGLVDPAALAVASPGVAVALVCGAVDGEALARSGIAHAPDWRRLQPHGTMHASPAILGPGPVLHLYAAGLAVGAAAARARRAGASPEEAERLALATSPGLPISPSLPISPALPLGGDKP